MLFQYFHANICSNRKFRAVIQEMTLCYPDVLLLEEIGVIFKLDLNDGCSRYELVHSEEEHRHHHLVCNECKAVFEVQDDLLDELEESIENKYGFKILDHSVKFFGICSECCKKHKSE